MFFQKTIREKTALWQVLVATALLFNLSSCTPPVPPPTSDPTLPVQITMEPQSTEYYVDGAAGSDSNPGSRSQPWKTIQKAADHAIAGDTITVQAGNYDERVQISTSGSASSPITFQANGQVAMHGFTIKADYISVRGFEITDTPDSDEDGVGIFVQGSYCDLENNYIYFATQGGIDLSAKPGNYAQTAHCTVKDNRLDHNSQYGINLEGQDHLVEGNEIWRTIQYHPAWVNPPSWVDADGIRFFGSGHTIQRNYIHDINYSDPENVNPHIDCFQTFKDSNHEAASNTTLEQNQCDNAAQARSVDEGGTGFTIDHAGPGILVRNNVIKAFADVFISNSDDVSILNNTIVSDTTLNTQYYPVGAEVDNSTNIVIENNIFFDQPGQVIYVKNSGVVGETNIVYRDDGIPPVTSKTYNPINDLWNVNPLFVNPAANDYHLQSQSPAIDAGLELKNVPNDYEGHPRPAGQGLDIGAYEFSGN
jgi:hypothetical protein